MKLGVYLKIILFYTCSPTVKMFLDLQDTITLIKTVRQYYSASCVVVLFPNRNDTTFDNLLVANTVDTWTRALHREKITTLSMSFSDMKLLTKYYYNVPRPMIIMFFIELSWLHTFSQNTGFLRMSAFTWLIIFDAGITKKMDDYCYNPPGNMFHLAYDTEMLVACTGSKTLHEWYSIDGNTTETAKLANWTYNKENPSLSTMDLYTNLSLYDRRNNLKGKVLRGVFVKSSLIFAVGPNKSSGYFATMIHELQNALNFTLDIAIKVMEFGTLNETTKRWRGAMHYVAAGIVDIGVSDFTMTNNRLGFVDFLNPIITTRSCMHLKQPEVFAVKWFAYFKAFDFSIWKSLLVVFVISLFTVAFIKTHVQLRKWTDVVCDEFLLILGILCQQGLLEFPRHSSLRVAYITMLLTAIVVLSAYSASLICFLAARVRDLPFSSIKELLDDDTYRVIVLRGSAEYDMFFLSKEPLGLKVKKAMLPSDDLPHDVESGFRRICEDPKLAFYISNMDGFIKAVHIPCKVTCINYGRINSMSFILPKGSQYTTALNFHLQKLINSGILNRYRKNIVYEEPKIFQPVGFGSVASVVLIFACGVFLAFLLLVVEVWHNKWKKLNNSVNRAR